MARFALVALMCGGVALLPRAADAQLRTLHVRDFSMSVDHASVPVDAVFHLTIRARVTEPVASLDEITLPNLSAFEELGDERRCTTSPGGTQCLETLTLEAPNAGTVTIAPASLDAVDGRNGRPSRFKTNALVMTVTAARPEPAVSTALERVVRIGKRVATLVALLSASVLALAWVRSRTVRERRRGAPTQAPMPALEATPIQDADARLRELVRALAQEPTRARAVAVRSELRARAGAGADETLADLISRAAVRGADGAALAAIERASFCQEAYVADAVREALPYLP